MSLITRSGDDLSNFVIGNFGDRRLLRVGALLFKRLTEKLTVTIKTLAGDRATEVAFSRFLSNSNVEAPMVSDELAKKTNEGCIGKSHVLCLQDTVELTYPAQSVKKSHFGSTSHADTKGLLAHPGVIVDASNRDVIGTSSVIVWSRNDSKKQTKRSRQIEEKESIRWITTALSARKNITNAQMITVIGDRENDLLEVFEQVPDKRTHLIVRAAKDRMLETEEKISEVLVSLKRMGTYEIELPAITGKRKARKATLEIKYTPISLKDREGEPINIYCVSAMEMSTIPPGETRISWVLLTTHLVDSIESAKQILIWYSWRWIIEQIFRTMKNKGLRIEDSQIEDPKKLQILSILCIATAIRVMSLVESRDGKNNRKASDLFTQDELKLLSVICKKLEGKTEKQKNPHRDNLLGWVSWIIARLGGWNGYRSESPPGPIVMLRGLQKFELQYEGWLLAK
jgi:hypothetical protein